MSWEEWRPLTRAEEVTFAGSEQLFKMHLSVGWIGVEQFKFIDFVLHLMVVSLAQDRSSWLMARKIHNCCFSQPGSIAVGSKIDPICSRAPPKTVCGSKINEQCVQSRGAVSINDSEMCHVCWWSHGGHFRKPFVSTRRIIIFRFSRLTGTPDSVKRVRGGEREFQMIGF